MVRCSSLLVDRVLDKVLIAFLDLLEAPSEFEVGVKWLHVVLKQWVLLPRLATLELLDVIHVRVSAVHEADEYEREPAFSLIVHAVRLVPIWELPNVLVSVRSFVTFFHISINPMKKI